MIRKTTRTINLKYSEFEQRQEHEWAIPATLDSVDKRTQDEVIVSRGYVDENEILTSIRIDNRVAILTSPQRAALIIALADVWPSSERSAPRPQDGQAT